MKTVLFLAGRYFPKASPNSICMQAIINGLPKEDYKIKVVCYEDGFSTEYSFPVIKISRGIIQRLLYRFEQSSSRLSKRVIQILRKAINAKQIFCYLIWPWTDPVFTLKELRCARSIYKTDKYDIIIAIYMPLSSLIVANRIKKEHPKVIYIPYFLDALSGGNAPRFMKQTTYENKARKWEKRLTENADKIVFMKSVQQHISKFYKESEIVKKTVFLDIPLLTKRDYIARDNQKMILVYVGSLPVSVRSPEYLLKVFSKIPNDDWEFIFVGETTCEVLNYYAKNDRRIKVLGRCSHKEALYYESIATALVNFGNKNTNLTPSKIFEYISWRKKIVSTICIEGDTSVKYLDYYPEALILNENDQDIDDAAIRLSEFLKASKKDISYEELKKIYFENTPEAFISIIQN